MRKTAECYLEQFSALLARLDIDAVASVVQRLAKARDEGATLYIAGNGGSAALASHWANDLGKAVKKSGRAPIRVQCLADNTPWLTALANDEGYERVFAGQLENFARRGDVLIVISASGNSPNLLRAVELAVAREMDVVGVLGFDGGALRNMVTHLVLFETAMGAYGLAESGHAVIADMVTTCLMNDRSSD